MRLFEMLKSFMLASLIYNKKICTNQSLWFGIYRPQFFTVVVMVVRNLLL